MLYMKHHAITARYVVKVKETYQNCGGLDSCIVVIGKRKKEHSENKKSGTDQPYRLFRYCGLDIRA